MLLCIAALSIKSAYALEVADVKSDYWAADEIKDCLERGYFRLDNNNRFLPEGKITRADFVNILLKVIQSDDLNYQAKSNFVDVNHKTPLNNSIITSQQMRIIFGYPDHTFKPNSYAKRSEATSVIANVTKSAYEDSGVLKGFKDANDIPSWALSSYIQNVMKDLYINYPDPKMLKPNGYITRAEAAVLFAKISDNLDLVRSKYRNKKGIKEVFIGEQTLAQYSKAPRYKVDIYNTKKIIEAGNVVRISPVDDVNSKVVEKGQQIIFVSPVDTTTVEGTVLYPKGTEFSATVKQVKNSKWRNKQDKALLIFDKITIPDGESVNMAGVPYVSDFGNVIFVNAKNSKRKIKESSKEISKADFLLRYSRKLVPVVKYDVKANDEVYLLLTGDLVLPDAHLYADESGL